MCGLYGYFGNVFDDKRTTRKEWSYFGAAAAVSSQFRGVDGVGWLSLSYTPKGRVWERRRYAKSATEAILEDKNKPDYVSNVLPQLHLGHVRAATVGDLTVDFTHPHIIADKDNYLSAALTHNGTLYNHDRWSLKTAPTQALESDSWSFLYLLKERGIKEALEETMGAFAIAYYDSEKDILSLARNDERPLYVARTEEGIWWASNPAFVNFAIEYSGVRTTAMRLHWEVFKEEEILHTTLDHDTGKVSYDKEEFTELNYVANSPGYYGGRSWTSYTFGSSNSKAVTIYPHKTSKITTNYVSFNIPKGTKVDKTAKIASLYQWRIRCVSGDTDATKKYGWDTDAYWDKLENYANAHRKDNNPTTTLSCYVIKQDGNALRLSDFLPHRDVSEQLARHSKRHMVRQYSDSIVSFNVYNVPLSFAIGFMNDIGALMRVDVDKLLEDKSITFVDYKENTPMEAYIGWDDVKEVETTITNRDVVVVVPAHMFNEQSLMTEDGPIGWYCEHALKQQEALVFSKVHADGEVQAYPPHHVFSISEGCSGELEIIP